MSRAENRARVVGLKAEGKSSRQIAESLGLSYTYVRELLVDPDGAKVRARKARYGGTCLDCGRQTDGSNGPAKAPKRCKQCTPAANAHWTREAIIERIQAWNAIYGRPPSAEDWNPAMARERGREDIARRWEVDGCWPWVTQVQYRFGRWNAAIEAAGFTPRRSGARGPVRPPATPLVEVAA